MSFRHPIRRALAHRGETYGDLAELTGLSIPELRRVARGEPTRCDAVCLIAAALDEAIGPLLLAQLPEADRPKVSEMDAPHPRDLPPAWEQLEEARKARGLDVHALPGSSRTYYKVRSDAGTYVATLATYARFLRLDLSPLVFAHGLPAVIERGL